MYIYIMISFPRCYHWLKTPTSSNRSLLCEKTISIQVFLYRDENHPKSHACKINAKENKITKYTTYSTTHVTTWHRVKGFQFKFKIKFFIIFFINFAMCIRIFVWIFRICKKCDFYGNSLESSKKITFFVKKRCLG